MDMVRALPRQIRDHETGEDFDVIGDDDILPFPSEEPGDEARHDRAERGVEDGGRRGAGVRPTQAVPRVVTDEATGEVLEVVQDNDPDLPPESDQNSFFRPAKNPRGGPNCLAKTPTPVPSRRT
jgi:hypothetical protein